LELPPSQIERYRLDEPSLRQVQQLGAELLQHALGEPIRYWETL
jgi:hypothetical protein